MIRVVTRNDWPDNLDWHDLPEGAKWLTVRRAPVPYVNLREKERPDVPIRAFVGCPMPLDPSVRYQFQNLADPRIDAFTVPDPAMVAVWRWDHRVTELVCSDFPLPGGSVYWAARITKVQAAAFNQTTPRHTTDGLRAAAMQWESAGTITLVSSFDFDPDSAAVGNGIFMSSALAANALVMPRSVGLYPSSLTFGQGHSFMPRGLYGQINFPITTVPTVALRFTGTPVHG